MHCVQVHKETLDKIPEALPNRNSVDIDIYGTQGIPEEDVREHERLKRGDDGPSKSSQDNNRQNQPKIQSTNPVSYATMQNAMLQHALGMGLMPPLIPPPPTGSAAPFLQPPPGYPPMVAPLSSIPLGLSAGFLPPPPPPPMVGTLPPNIDFSKPPPPLGPMPSTSSGIIPPPLSGVGHLIGIPPPPFIATNGAPFLPNLQEKPLSSSHQAPHLSYLHDAKVNRESTTTVSSPPAREEKPDIAQCKPATTSTISKPALTGLDNKVDIGNVEFIEIPGTKSRIVHPNRDLSIEEMRITWKRYATS